MRLGKRRLVAQRGRVGRGGEQGERKGGLGRKTREGEGGEQRERGKRESRKKEGEPCGVW